MSKLHFRNSFASLIIAALIASDFLMFVGIASANVADLNNDGEVDVRDLAIWAYNMKDYDKGQLIYESPNDLNGDKQVDVQDSAIWAANFGDYGKGQLIYESPDDLNGDGEVDVRDLAIWAYNMKDYDKGQLIYESPNDLNGDGEVDVRDLAIWAANFGYSEDSDVIAPIITITGINPLTVALGSVYIDAGATATDNVDAIVTVVPSGTVDTATVGTYIITYSAVDVAGNVAVVVARTVNVTDQTAPVLGSAGDYAILAKTAVTTTGTTVVTGNIGISPNPATSIEGFGLALDSTGCFSVSDPLSLVIGKIYAADYNTLGCTTPAILTTAVSDMETAYTNTAGQPHGVGLNLNRGGGTLAGLTLAPGVYTWNTPGNVTITGDITLAGTATDVWIFQISGTLDIATDKKIILAGALPQNIFWQVAGAVTLGTGSHFDGNILAQTNIAMQTGATLNGRALAQSAVTLDANTVTNPSVTPIPPAPITLTSIAITIPATKLSYTVGELLSIAGLVVTGTYSDSSATPITITTDNVTGFSSSTPVTGQILTITFEGKTVTYTVNIVAAQGSSPSGGGGAQPTFTISEESIRSTINELTVTINWSTNYFSTSQVIYGAEGELHTLNMDDNTGVPPKYGYAQTTIESDTAPKVTYHTVIIAGLDPSKTYYYRAVYRGSFDMSNEYAFVTPSTFAPILAQIPAPSGEITPLNLPAEQPVVEVVLGGTPITNPGEVITEIPGEVTTPNPTPSPQTPANPNPFAASLLSVASDYVWPIVIILLILVVAYVIYLLIKRRKKQI